MKGQYFVVAAFIAYFCCCAASRKEEPRWVWSTSGRNRRERAFHDERSERFRGEVFPRAERDREPTTKRPTPGAPLNEEIDDYPDGDAKNNVAPRQSPLGPNGFNGGQIAGGGFNNYPGIGSYVGNPAVNGILVGPGGPTGIIGRPQQYFPQSAGGQGGAGFPGAFGQPGFGNAGSSLGFPQQQQPGGIGFGNGVGGFGQAQGYPGAQQSGQNPGAFYNGGQYPANGQYPAGNQYPLGNQFGGNQFPGANTGQYPAVNSQFPGSSQYPSGSQYPGGNQYPGGSQYPSGGPIFTEGYGLFSNNYHPQVGVGIPQTPFGGINGFGTGFDEQNQPKRKLQIEGKSAAVENRNVVDKTVDDKVSRSSTKPK